MAKKTPQIRFKGFSNDWKQHKVGEFLLERNEQAPVSKEYPLMAFIANKGVAPKGERYDRSSLVTDKKNKKYKKTEFGDFIYSSNNLETGSIGLNNFGKASISPVYSIFKTSSLSNSNFIGRRFLKKDFINDMLRWRQGVVYGQFKIHESDFLKIDIFSPNLEEQQKIGKALDKIENLINFQQNKCDNLKLLKSSLLQKMFPKDGETTPKIRFEGFSDDWEQRKLSKIVNYTKGFAFKSKDYQNEGFRIIRVSDLSKDSVREDVDMIYYNGDNINQYLEYFIKEGEIVVTTVGSKAEMKDSAVGRPLIFNNYKYQLLNQNLVKLEPLNTVNSYFIYSQLLQEKYSAYISSIERGNANQANITITELLKYNIFMPHMKEQVKVAVVFQKLDNLITLHQRKCDTLKELKKAMLQKMFV